MDVEKLDSSKTKQQNVKSRFFAFRNGVVADLLRKSGDPHRIIFGLNLPQLKEIAEVFKGDDELAQLLWGERHVRESRLLAPMLVNIENLSFEDAEKWLGGLTENSTAEVCDMLCHFMLKRAPFYREIVELYINSPEAWLRYVALRLCFNDIVSDAARVQKLAKAELERADEITVGLARHLAAEAAYILED